MVKKKFFQRLHMLCCFCVLVICSVCYVHVFASFTRSFSMGLEFKITRSTCSLREPSRGSCYYIYAYFTPRGPRITHPKNGCDRFSRFCGTWKQTDGRTVNYSKILCRYSLLIILHIVLCCTWGPFSIPKYL